MTSNLPVILCVQDPKGEWFVLPSIGGHIFDSSRHLPEAAARAQLKEAGFSDAEIEAEVEHARQWATTLTRRVASEDEWQRMLALLEKQ